MKVKIKCLKKNRDAKGNIKSYLLQKETGEVFEATGQQIKNEIAANNYEFINLQIDKAGRLIDKAVQNDSNTKVDINKAEPDIYEIKDVKSFNEWLHSKKVGDIKIKFNRPAKLWELVEEDTKYFGKTYALRITGTHDYWSGGPLVSSLLNIREWVDTVAYACLIQDKKIDNFEYTGEIVKANSIENANRLLYIKGLSKKEDWRYDMEIKALNDKFVLVDKKNKKIKFESDTPGEVLKLTLDDMGYGYPDYVYESLTKNDVIKKIDMCKKKIKIETIKALEEGIVTFINHDSVHATDRYSEEIKKVRKVWNSLLPDMPAEFRESFETLEFDLAEAAVFYTEHGRKLCLGVAINDFAGMESNYSYSEERILSACNALAYDIAGLLVEREEYDGWEREDLINEAKNYVDTNVDGFKVDPLVLLDQAIEELKNYTFD